jgi:nucleoside-diphosphate-sugar epimerase
MGQYETELMGKETGTPVSVLMLHNVYGSPCDYGERSQVIPALIRKAVKYPDEEFIVWGSGRQGRAFIHVDDVVNAIALALVKGWDKGIIQIGPSVCTSIREIAETIVGISGKDISIRYDEDKPEGDLARCADYSKAQAVLGWQPSIGIADGLRMQYRWIEQHLKQDSKA